MASKLNASTAELLNGVIGIIIDINFHILFPSFVHRGITTVMLDKTNHSEAIRAISSNNYESRGFSRIPMCTRFGKNLSRSFSNYNSFVKKFVTC